MRRTSISRTFTLEDLPGLTSLQRLRAAVRGKCPHCGCGRMFCGVYQLRERCEVCGTPFERQGGEWTGAMWLTVSMSAVLGLAAWAWLFASGHSFDGDQYAAGLVSTAFGLGAYRYVKAWWIWFGYLTGFVYSEPLYPEHRRRES